MFQLKYYFTKLTERLWLRPALYCLLALATAALAAYGQRYVPDDISLKIGAEAVDQILNILSSSLLAVTTFSLGTMVSAYSAAASSTTPRVTALLLSDSFSQKVLASFIGGFLFSLVSLIMLKTGTYNNSGRVILFVVTLVVVAAIVIMLVRWVDYLARFGRVNDAIGRVETAAIGAMERRRDAPCLGGTPWRHADRLPTSVDRIGSAQIGYVETIDMAELSALAEAQERRIYVVALPGKFIDMTGPLAWIETGVDDEVRQQAADCFVISKSRSFLQDPRFGLCVLSEIASRALSPAVNDPGTAIEVIGRGVRAFHVWADHAEEQDKDPKEPDYPLLHVPELDMNDMFDDFFSPIARDGAGLIEVQMRLQKALRSLAEANPGLYGAAARRHSRQALELARSAMVLETDVAVLEHISQQIAGSADGKQKRSS